MSSALPSDGPSREPDPPTAWRAGPAAALATVLALALVLGASITEADAAKPSSLPRGKPLPAPDVLYREPARSPQLANRGPWKAKPILVSGASAYRKGEFLYQDFLYDDHGARGKRDPGDPRSGSDNFSQPSGTYTYPTDPVYAGNAADLVELRVKARRRATEFRITLNTLNDPELVATTIAIGDSPEPREVPHGASARAPAELFLTVHGRTAELLDAASGEAVEPKPRAKVSMKRRQIDVRVPHAAWDPGRRNVSLAAGVGLWDPEGDRYLIPAEEATESRPGGAGGIDEPTAFFNVAFRYDEPFQVILDALTDPAWWRDKLQGERLIEGDLGAFATKVNFRKLERGVSDQLRGKRRGAPRRGPMNRILVSHLETKQGTDYSTGCTSAERCKGQLRGRLQPYAIYMPKGKRPNRGWGLTLLLHSLDANYNQFSGTRNQSQFGERGRGSVVITPAGRGPDGWYTDHAEADTFEVWADVARRYRLHPRFTSIAGYSMGGYGTYKLATRYPGLFARANPVVGPPGLGIWTPPAPPAPGGEASLTTRMLPSVRHIPFLIWVAVADELVPYPGVVAHADEFDRLGLRYRFDSFGGEHLTLAANDEYAPAAAFLGDARVVRNPAHVSYVLNPTMDFPKVGVEADGAYWISGMRLRDGSGEAPLGRVDARSLGFGEADPEPEPTQFGGGTLEGGDLGPLAFTSQSKDWGEAPSAPKRDRLEIEAENLSRLKVHPRRARLSCDAEIAAQTDGPLIVRLAGCGRRERFTAR